MSQQLVLQQLREHLAVLKTEYGVEKIGVFGSVARGNDHDDSDVDLVVKLNRPLGFKFYHLVEYLEKVLNKKVDLLTEEGVKNIRIQEVEQEINQSVLYV